MQPQHGTHRLGILHGARYATLQDLELALEAALSVNQHLNQEIESVLQRLKQVEQERDAWQQRAGQLAKQLQSERVQRHTEGGGELPASPPVSTPPHAGGSSKQRAIGSCLSQGHTQQHCTQGDQGSSRCSACPDLVALPTHSRQGSLTLPSRLRAIHRPLHPQSLHGSGGTWCT